MNIHVNKNLPAYTEKGSLSFFKIQRLLHRIVDLYHNQISTALRDLSIYAYRLECFVSPSVTWFKQVLLPESLQRCEVKTIRRVVLKVPGNVVGTGRYQHIRLAPSPMLESIVTRIQLRTREFAKRRMPDLQHTA